MEPSIYQFPSIFRRVHMEQPGEIEDEVEFLKRVWRRHLGRQPRRVLDIASGDSPHGQILAREGKSVVGIDRSATMIAAGRKNARGLDRLRFYRRRIESFTIPERKFDVAFFMSETFPVIIDNTDLIAHLHSVGRLLRRGGLYCVDIDRMDTIRRVPERRMWQRRDVTVDGTAVEVRAYNRPLAWHSALHSIYELECTIHFFDRDVITRDLVPIRYTVPATLELAAWASRMFKLEAVYADLSLATPLDECDRRWLGVMRRV